MSLPFEIERLLPEIRSQVEQCGAELVDLEFRRAGSRGLLTVTADKAGGITLDDCAGISEKLGRYFDELPSEGSSGDPIAGSYVLEVVSPGLDRPLKKREDFVKAEGEFLKISFRRENQEMATWTARLLRAEESGIQIELKDGNQACLGYEVILKAVREINWNLKANKEKRR